MIRNLILFLFLSLILSPLNAFSIDPMVGTKDRDLKVALVLSGGGARGFADIPIIQALEDADIPIDMVIGTSMGALVGGLYASGYSPSQMVELIGEYDMAELFAVSPVSYRSPELSVFAEHKNNVLSLEFDEEGIGRAPGIIGDQKVMELLNDSLIKISGIRDFDDLPIPFRAIGTDLVTGEKIIFSDGSLVAAIRGSISIPGFFAPAILDGRAVVDGGLVDNLPIQVALDMGADIIIAVDVNEGDSITELSKLDSLSSVFEQLVTIVTANTYKDQMDKVNLLLSPDLSRYGLFDFIHYEDIMAIGKAYALEERDRIEALHAFLEAIGDEHSGTESSGTYDSLPDITIHNILHTRIMPDENRLDIFPLESFDDFEDELLDEQAIDQLALQLEEMRESDRYATVTYRITDITYDEQGNPSGDLDIVTRDFAPRHVTLSLGLFGSSSVRVSPDVDAVFDFDPDFSVEFNIEEFLHKNLSFNFSIVQMEAITIDAALRYNLSPALSFSMNNEYTRGYLSGSDTVIPGTNDGEDYSFKPSISAFITYRNSAEVKLTAAFNSLWYMQSGGGYDYRFVPSLSLGGVYTTQNFSLFPKQGVRLDFSAELSSYNLNFGYRFDFRGMRTWKVGGDDYLTVKADTGLSRSVAHRRDDYLTYGGYSGIVSLSPSLRVKDRVLASISYVHEHKVSAIPLMFTVRISGGVRGESTETIYALSDDPYIEPFEFFTDPQLDLTFSTGLGVKIQNADILFGVALDANMSTAFFVEVH